jgi:hypothetical protein
MPEERTGFLTPVMLALAISLLMAAGAILLLCELLLHHSLTWTEIALITIGAVLASVLVHAVTLWTLAAGGSDYVEAKPQELISGSWLAAAWLPALILLTREGSIWIAALAPWMTAQLAALLGRLRQSPTEVMDDEMPMAAAGAQGELTLFQFGRSPAAVIRNALPVAVTSLAWQCGIAALAGGETPLAALLFSSGVVFPCWYPIRSMHRNPAGLRPVRACVCLLLAMLATLVTLMPMGLHHAAAMRAAALLGVAETERSIAQQKKTTMRRGTHYSGVILTMPPLHLRNLVAPPLNLFHPPNPNAVPAVIPFDGAYWYFQVPDERPGADAYEMRGDPIHVRVRATNEYPLTMEAHQLLEEPIRLNCCHAIRVDLRSTEYGAGGVYLGIILRNTKSNTSFPLDNQVLPSSVDARLEAQPAFARAPAEESLSFPLPRAAKDAQFNEIVVTIRLVRDTVLNGPRVAVKQFALLR